MSSHVQAARGLAIDGKKTMRRRFVKLALLLGIALLSMGEANEKLVADDTDHVKLRGPLGWYGISAEDVGRSAALDTTPTRNGRQRIAQQFTGKADAAVASDAPVVILKLDDFRPGGQLMPDSWQRVTDFLAERNLKASYGISGKDIIFASPAFCDWVGQQHNAGSIEFWNHGYTHSKTKIDGKSVAEFRDSYDKQKATLKRTQGLGRKKFGFAFTSFGAPFNAINTDTAKAMHATPDLNIWLFGKEELAKKGGFTGTILTRKINMEMPVTVPNFEAFHKRYLQGGLGDCLVLQGHPNNWKSEERFGNFVKIIDFLQEQGHVFMTPREYAAIRAAH